MVVVITLRPEVPVYENELYIKKGYDVLSGYVRASQQHAAFATACYGDMYSEG